MRRDTITRELRCPFTPETMAEMANKLAHGIADLQSIEEDKKVSNSAFKER
jgi:hypothetical protein